MGQSTSRSRRRRRRASARRVAQRHVVHAGVAVGLRPAARRLPGVEAEVVVVAAGREEQDVAGRAPAGHVARLGDHVEAQDADVEVAHAVDVGRAQVTWPIRTPGSIGLRAGWSGRNAAPWVSCSLIRRAYGTRGVWPLRPTPTGMRAKVIRPRRPTVASPIVCRGWRRRSVGLPGLKIWNAPSARHLVQRDVAVAEDHGGAAGERRPLALEPPARRAGVVDHPDAHAARLDDAARRQPRPQLGRVDVAVHGGDRRAERLEVVEHRAVIEVARVEDQVGGAQPGDAVVRQARGRRAAGACRR